MWYPSNKKELEYFIDKSFEQTTNHKPPTNIQGIIVPHAGYEYSGIIAGKAFSLLQYKGKVTCKGTVGSIRKAIVIGPSHHINLSEVITTNQKYLETPLEKTLTFNSSFPEGNISSEHSINNQIPFLQKLGIKEIMPLMVGKITNEQAKEIAKKISKIKATYIFSTDLSHFYDYEKAIKTDKNTIKILKNLDFNNFKCVDACGYFPLLIIMHLCKIKKTHPRLIEYKNSGDVTGDKSSVVGYCGMWF